MNTERYVLRPGVGPCRLHGFWTALLGIDTEPAKDEDQPAWLKAINEVKEKTDDPVVEGLAHIGNFVMESTKSLDKRIDQSEEKSDKADRNLAKFKTGIETQIEAGFTTVSERIDSLRKRQIITGAASASPFSGGDRLLAVIPEDKKHLIYQAEQTVSKMDRNRVSGGSHLHDAPFKTLMALWFHTATKLQCPKHYGGYQTELREQLDKYEKAFADVYGGMGLDPEKKGAGDPWSTGAGASGGFLVPTIVAAELLRIAKDSGVVVSRARHIPMGSNVLKIPNEATGIDIGWGTENVALTKDDSSDHIGENTLTAARLECAVAASIESIEDSVIGLIDYISLTMAEAMGKELDLQALEGSGAPHSGVNAASGVNQVVVNSAATSSDGGPIDYIDLVKAVYAADESSVEAGAAWFMHRKIFASIVGLRGDAASVGDGKGMPVFMSGLGAAGIAGSPFGSILGFPVFTTSAIATTTTRGATPNTSNVYFGDPKKVIFGDRQQLGFDVTDTGPGWAKYQVDMRMTGRFGLTIATPAAFSKIVGCVQLGAPVT